MDENYWEHFPHEADIGIRGVGSTLEAAFAMAALALSHVISETSQIEASEEVLIHCSAPDLELLLVDWINAIIYEMQTRRMLFSQFTLTIQNLSLEAKIKGEPLKRERHLPVVEVKGATFTELKVYQKNNSWLAQCVVDV